MNPDPTPQLPPVLLQNAILSEGGMDDWLVIDNYRGTGQPEGSLDEWRSILNSMKRREGNSFKRVEVIFDSNWNAWFCSPRNSMDSYSASIKADDVDEWIKDAEERFFPIALANGIGTDKHIPGKWQWMADWCKKKGISPFVSTNWINAEKEWGLANGIGVVPSKSGSCVDKQGNSLIEAGDEVENNDARFFADLTSGYLVGIDKTKLWSLKNESSKMAECIRQGNYACHSMKLTFVEPLPSAPVGEPDGIQSKPFGEVWVACHVGKGVSCIGKTESDALRGVRDALETHKAKLEAADDEPIEVWNPLEHGIRNVPLMVPSHLHNKKVSRLERELAAANSEKERLTGCLKRANDNFAEYERRWYLTQDELSQANAAVGAMRCALEAYEKWEGAVSRSRPDDSNAVQNGRVELLQIAKELRDKAFSSDVPPAPDGWRKIEDVSEWANNARKKFNLPVPRKDPWWEGYNGALNDLEVFLNVQPLPKPPTGKGGEG